MARFNPETGEYQGVCRVMFGFTVSFYIRRTISSLSMVRGIPSKPILAKYILFHILAPCSCISI
ncbi:hypothetical protein MTR_7g082880 [Medicago truncatula]|uniref:Uncharacterized protein n=1 Tax=Medicago truncatula TaxID=3880 RepID=G7KV97_MEDTR|nr:hypothetical protein MTR_7g082880 [Medicago truncatula]